MAEEKTATFDKARGLAGIVLYAFGGVVSIVTPAIMGFEESQERYFGPGFLAVGPAMMATGCAIGTKRREGTMRRQNKVDERYRTIRKNINYALGFIGAEAGLYWLGYGIGKLTH